MLAYVALFPTSDTVCISQVLSRSEGKTYSPKRELLMIRVGFNYNQHFFLKLNEIRRVEKFMCFLLVYRSLKFLRLSLA